MRRRKGESEGGRVGEEKEMIKNINGLTFLYTSGKKANREKKKKAIAIC